MVTMKTYYAERTQSCGEENVWISENGVDRLLPVEPSIKVIHHAPGFQWGYAGSGPSQLALAILLDFTKGNIQMSKDFYQRFKFEFVAKWQDSWSITENEIHAWIKENFDNILDKKDEDKKKFGM